MTMMMIDYTEAMVSSRESLVQGVVCERLRRIETRATGAVAQLTVRSVCRTDVRL